ncbi:OmpA family protein [Fulvivirgaceae bacterium BMA12]|uniref:OmpA family protein n=1 Tax=Agaribacillus aureus TaxID=3051825 RepID=A0ABT8L404_9BACT|nr:OmpA family protein [Fulvivirgaceae bacterium BMA12]
MYKLKWFLGLGILFIILNFDINAQNLVRNGSFENASACPVGLDELAFCDYWLPFGTNHPSPDYFHSCSSPHRMGIPNNAFGHQYAKSGQAYAGLIAYLTVEAEEEENWELSNNHREFIQTYLTYPLEEGKTYYAEFHVSLVEDCDYAIANLGLLMTVETPELTWPKIQFEYFKPQIRHDRNLVIADNKTWTKISGTFKAKGGENVLTIGNFDNDERTKVKKNKSAKLNNIFRKKFLPKIAYYYIDDVKVMAVDSLNKDVQTQPAIVHRKPLNDEYFGTISVGDKVQLNNIYFEFDKATLLAESFFELNKLFNLLQENQDMEIRIEGHTDIIGSDKYNETLSRKRAEAVVDYLVKKGIGKTRIFFKGYGRSAPVASNESEKGRSLNRRVEFLILKK